MAADQNSARSLVRGDDVRGANPLASLSLHDLESLRLLLRGASVIDWRRLSFTRREEVDAFLKLHLIDADNPTDRALLQRMLADAVEYLRSTYRYRVADAVAKPREIHDIFLMASGVHPKHPERYRKIACIVLKVMHVIHHLEGRELLYRTPVAESVIADMVHKRVTDHVEAMRTLGFPIVEFTGGMKTRNSIITKLIAKKETVAAQIFDKVRFRIVTKRPEDVVPVLVHLTRTLFPFNYVVPSQTENTLISFKRLVEKTPALRAYVDQLHLPLKHEQTEEREKLKQAGGNPFSGGSYKVLNFIIDVPLRIDEYLQPEDRLPGRPKTVFSLAEFQVVDEQTAIANEKGENSHDRYKHRQKLKVLRRLSRGLVVPKGDKPDKPAKPGESGPKNG